MPACHHLPLLGLAFAACALPSCQPGAPAPSVALHVPEATPRPPHELGGWYCPDNVNGFAPVNLLDWKDVPVVTDRLPTLEETRNGTALMFVDTAVHPDARPLDLPLPQLARYDCAFTGKQEWVIVIQGVQVDGQEIVGFRFLSGGNGSAWLDEVDFLSEAELTALPDARFALVKQALPASSQAIMNLLTDTAHLAHLLPAGVLDPALDPNWRDDIPVNWAPPIGTAITAVFADELWGVPYIQVDGLLDGESVAAKFLVLPEEDGSGSRLSAIVGPFTDEFETAQAHLQSWTQRLHAAAVEAARLEAIAKVPGIPN